MEWTSKEVVQVISYLLPGFVAAWVFLGLTPSPKQSQTQFERVIQALIFLSIVQAIVGAMRFAFGGYITDYHANQVLPPVVAIVVGIVAAHFANNDTAHRCLRWIGLTKRTSHPSNWYSAFNEDRRWVTLHLDDGLRVYGWPYEFPDHPETGHFSLMCAYWVPDEGEPIPLPLVEKLLIPAERVEMVELMKQPTVKPEDRDDGKSDTGTTPAEPKPTVRPDEPQGIAGPTNHSAATNGVAAATPNKPNSAAKKLNGKRHKRGRRR